MKPLTNNEGSEDKMQYRNIDKENINLMTRDSDGLTFTERQVLETYEVFEDKLRDASPETLATLVLADKTERLWFTIHQLNQHLTDINDNIEHLNEKLNQFERLNCDQPKRKQSTGRSRLFRYQFGIEVLLLVYSLIERIVVVIQCFI